MELSVADYAVLCGGIFISMAVGLFFAIKDRNKMSLQRYHRGDSKLQVLPVAISLLVTKESSLFFLGYPAEVYAYGAPFFLTLIGKTFGSLIVICVSIPMFFPLGLTSVFEYLERRHGSVLVRRIAVCMNALFEITWAAVILFGASIALNSEISAESWVFIVGMAAVAVVYTALGGIKAVVFADVIQSVLMLLTMIAIVANGVISVGGIKKVIDLNRPSGRLKMFDFDPNPLVRNSFWAIFIGDVIFGFSYINSQTMVQRLSSTRSKQDARKVMFIFVPCFIAVELLAMSEGLIAFAYYTNKGCDPLASGRIKNANQIIPITVFDMFGHIPGFVGLYLASLTSAALSTLSSLFGSMSAVVTEELKENLLKDSSQARKTNISKLLAVVFAFVCVGLALVIGQSKGPLVQIAYVSMSVVIIPLTGMFVLSIFFRSTSAKGIIVGATAGVMVGVLLSTGSTFSAGVKRTPMLPLGTIANCETKAMDAVVLNHTHEFHNKTNDVFISQNSSMNTSTVSGMDVLFSISFYHFTTINFSLTVLIGFLASMLFKPASQPADLSNLTMILPCSNLCRPRSCKESRRQRYAIRQTRESEAGC